MKFYKYNILFEICSQNIPYHMQESAAKQLVQNFINYAKKFLIFIPSKELSHGIYINEIISISDETLQELENNQNNLSYKLYFSPSRIAFKAELIVINQTQKKFIKGPRVKDEFDMKDDIALSKFIEKHNITIENIEIFSEKNSKYYGFCEEIKFNSNIDNMIDNLNKICLSSIENFKWPNSLFYEGSKRKSWIRPLSNIVVLIEGQDKILRKLDIEFANIQSSSKSIGHKILCFKNNEHLSESQINIERLSDYPIFLKPYFIIASQDQRCLNIINSCIEKSEYFKNYFNKDYPNKFLFSEIDKIFNSKHISKLIYELCLICDYPNAILCNIDNDFVQILPSELIEYVMISHQRYIPLIDENKNLKPEFIVIIDHNKISENMKIGYEKVLYARLLDAKFFFENLLKFNTKEMFNILNFHKSEFPELSIFELNSKIMNIFCILNKKYSLNLNESRELLDASKIDLCFEIIAEYPALRGIMSLYFLKQKSKENSLLFKDFQNELNEKILQNIESIINNIYYKANEIYKREDIDKYHKESRLYIIIEKIIRLKYFFLIKKQHPSASHDPFSLKRDINIIFDMMCIDDENALSIDIYDLFFDSEERSDDQILLENFLYKQLELYLINKINNLNYNETQLKKFIIFIIKNISSKQEKILKIIDDEKLNLYKIYLSIIKLFEIDFEQKLKDSYLRIFNLYEKKFKNNKYILESNYQFQNDEEIEIYDLIIEINAKLINIYDIDNYKKIINSFSDRLSNTINLFLDNILIDDENPNIRNNRIYLVQELYNIFEGKIYLGDYILIEKDIS